MIIFQISTLSFQINEKDEDHRSERLSWFDAVNFCRVQGADLVSIHSYEEEQKLFEFVSNVGLYTNVHFWIGLSAQESGSGYQWTDGKYHKLKNILYVI